MGTWMLNVVSFLVLVEHFVKSELLQTTYLHYENPTGVTVRRSTLFSNIQCATVHDSCSAFACKKDIKVCQLIDWKGGCDVIPLEGSPFHVRSGLCEDNHVDCPVWAHNGECDIWTMAQHCPFSCQYCGYEAGYGECWSSSNLHTQGSSLTECAKECSSRSQCNIFVYKHAERRCFLRNACNWNARTSGTGKIEVSYRKSWP